MAHQVLARKWRPRKFADVIGQEHVVKALSNALDSGRIHHAYLFTGTRGVGKTTLARILAKALNCLGADGQGNMTSTPCGVCASCTDIDAGRFVDLLEVDAATNTKVDEMRELLETAQYAPVSGRYKVYIIDEVHMLSKSAFNAMLKTLEEPPAHVEFILATTDPQKLPITVLSRCLQFNLRNLAPSLLAGHLQHILTAEKIAFEPAALDMIGRAGEGSARDALSLLDQAIAYGGGEVKAADVATMLGALDQTYLYGLLTHVAKRDAKALVAEIQAIATRAISFELTLKEFASIVANIALIQSVGADNNAASADGRDTKQLAAFATEFSPDDLQLMYQIALLGRRDLPLAPDEQSGFTMTMLRMIAFLGGSNNASEVSSPLVNKNANTSNCAPFEAKVAENARQSTTLNIGVPASATITDAPRDQTSQAKMSQAREITDWPAFVTAQNFLGMAGMLAKQAEFLGFSGNVLSLAVPAAQKHLADKIYLEKLKADLSAELGDDLRITVKVGSVGSMSVAVTEDRARSEAQRLAEDSIANDPFIKNINDDFGATVDRAAIRPITH